MEKENIVQVTEQVPTSIELIKEDVLEKIGLDENVLQVSRDQEKLAKLWAAYSKFLGEVEHPKQTKINPFLKNKYADLGSVLNEINPVASSHGLSIMQTPFVGEGYVAVTTILSHEDGAFIVFPALKLKTAKLEAQVVGSQITYARRYALSAICGVASEDDDDGESTSTDNRQKKPQVKPELKKLHDDITELAKKMAAEKKREKAIELIGYKGVVTKIKTEEEAKEIIGKLEAELKGDK